MKRALMLFALVAACGGARAHATDVDHDGVSDAHDRCSGVGEHADGIVDGHGCHGFESDGDQDGDGVRDAADDCPSEPATSSSNGCPDRDIDGSG